MSQLGYGSSGWLSGHLCAGEIRNASCAAAAPYTTAIPRKFLTVPGFDHRTFDSIKKMMARFGLYLGNRWMGLTF